MATERLPPVNLIIRDTLRGRVPSSDKAGQAVALSLTEFDDVRYLMLLEPTSPDLFQLSLAVPSDPSGTEGAKARLGAPRLHRDRPSALKDTSSELICTILRLSTGPARRGCCRGRPDVCCIRDSSFNAI